MAGTAHRPPTLIARVVAAGTIAGGLCLALAAPLPAQTTPEAPHRIALVVGVSDYAEAQDLPNPANDARAMAQSLWEAGFEVLELIDPDILALHAALRVTGDRLRPGAHAVFYFAGHGVQVASENYLLTGNVPISGGTEARALAHAISANQVVETFAASGADLSIIVLDACRNNPFAAAIGATPDDTSRSLDATPMPAATRGLAPILMPSDETEILLAYATAPGATAVDGPEGGNSPFTASIVEHMATEDLEIGLLFRRVRADVRELTGGQQIPWVNSSLESEFYFRAAETGPAANATVTADALGVMPPSAVVDAAFWRTVREYEDGAQLDAYLRHFPNGAFREEAEVKLAAASVPQDVPTSARPAARPVLTQFDQAQPDLGVLTTGTGGPLPLSLAGVPDAATVRFDLSGLSGGFDILGADGAPVTGPITGAAARGLTYRVPRTSYGDLGVLGLTVISDGTQIDKRLPLRAEIHPCDLVAGYQHDIERVGRGVRLELIDPALAVDACTTAVEAFPGEPRFLALLARGYRVAGEYDQAKAWNDRALQADYAAAYLMEGQLLRLGQGRPADPAAALPFYEVAAARGDYGALTEIGRMKLIGEGTAPDPAGGLALLHQAAATGHDWAHNVIGQAYHFGWGVPQSHETALGWYRAAADLGDISGKMRLGQFYEFGLGVAPDPERAFDWYQSAAGQGASYAQARFGKMYLDGIGAPADPQAAVYWFRQSAERGDPEGRFLLAEAILAGHATGTRDQALSLLQTASAVGHGNSSLRLARIYEQGDGVAADPARARALYEQAHAQGHGSAVRPYARALAQGIGGPVDGARAVAVLTAASDAGDTWARRDLARLLAAGEAVPEDPARSAALMRQAAEAGNFWALRDHARNLERGYGQPQDVNAAFAAMSTAAAADVSWARIDLARYHESGVGTVPDPVQAALWLARAHSLGDDRAEETIRGRLDALSVAAVTDATTELLSATGMTPDTFRSTLAARGAPPAPDEPRAMLLYLAEHAMRP